MGEDAPLELLQLASRLDPELLDELRACAAVQRERLALAPASVQREHQLRTRALAEGLLLRELLEESDGLSVAALGELCLGELLDHLRAKLVELRDLGLCERLVDDVGERRSPPEA